MLKDISELVHYRDLLWMWIQRDISVRYKQSFLGAAWAILQPLSLMLIFSILFTQLVKIQTDNIPYPVFSYAALLPWTFLSTSISFATTSLINNMNLITKIYFPREILPIASVGAGFVDFMIASVVFIGILLFYRIEMHWTVLWVPVVLAIQIIMTLGISILVAGLNVLYRDIRFVVPLGLQIWMYVSPVVYPTSAVPEWIRPWYPLNPMVGIIDAYRKVILEGTAPNFIYLGSSFVMAMLVFGLGYRIFKSLESQFADII